ncbi:hypothetical protein KC319_g45 [Hortaea werneckii]|nr:hypothetical protein KC319_g45 [Hortaea werneckii]
MVIPLLRPIKQRAKSHARRWITRFDENCSPGVEAARALPLGYATTPRRYAPHDTSIVPVRVVRPAARASSRDLPPIAAASIHRKAPVRSHRAGRSDVGRCCPST